VVTGVQLMKTGEYVFHGTCTVIRFSNYDIKFLSQIEGEQADINPVIAKCLDAKEICDLRMVHGLFPKAGLNLVQPKRSQYTEMLKIA
jgi:hypothetical protein